MNGVELDQLVAAIGEELLARVNGGARPAKGEGLNLPDQVCPVAGFPLGATSTEAKVAETAAALRAGAQEIDMVLNVGALRSGDLEAVKLDIAQVVKVAHEAG